MEQLTTVTFDDVRSASAVLKGNAHRTPVMTSQTLNERVGAEVFLKCENFQKIGAFKFRGAFNAISRLRDDEKARGVITYSSGNHAQAVAKTGQLLGIKTTIVMPTNAPTTKRAATEGYGATVIPYNPSEQDRMELAHEVAEKEGYAVIPPYDHPHVIAGQGTTALELFEDVPNLDRMLVCTGGGGLLSGCAIAVKGLSPQSKVIGIEPEVADDAARSFHTGTLHTIHNPPTIADGTRTPSLGKLTFPLVMQYVDDMRTVSEDAIKEAVRFLFYHMKLVVEPSGALCVAALLSGGIPEGGRIGLTISGGNIDAATMRIILGEGATEGVIRGGS